MAPESSRHVERALTVIGKARDTSGLLTAATMQRYRYDQKVFRQWCLDNGRRHMPATSETLADYTDALVQLGYARTTVAGKLTAVRALHRERGEPVPDGVAAWYVLRVTDATTANTAPAEKHVASRADIAAIAAICDTSTNTGVRDRCLATLAFDLMAGEVELLKLDIEDVTRTGSGLAVRISGRRLPVVPDDRLPDICPVDATTAWMTVLAEHGARSGPLFRPIDSASRIAGCGRRVEAKSPDGRLTRRGLRKIWAKLSTKAGLPPSTFRAVKLGGAVDDKMSGSTVTEVLDRGRYHTGMYRAVDKLIID